MIKTRFLSSWHGNCLEILPAGVEKGNFFFFLQFKFSFRNQEPGLGGVDISFTINHRQKSGYEMREVHLLRGTRRGRLGKEHNRSKGTMSCYSQVGPCTSPPHLPSQLGGGLSHGPIRGGGLTSTGKPRLTAYQY